MATYKITITGDIIIPLLPSEEEEIKQWLEDTLEFAHIHIHTEEIED